MKVAILTQPVGHNYGGLLQAFALQRYLRDLGHQVTTLDRRTQVGLPFAISQAALNSAKLVFGRIRSIPTPGIYEQIHRELISFRSQNIVLSERITTERGLRVYTRDQGFEAYVVGSDQVWRPRYSPSLANYFLDFLDDLESNPLRMSYAASFGVDRWELTPLETARCKELLARFHAVSVREPSGVRLCEAYLGRTPKCMVDPTLLYRRDFYESLALEGEPLLSGGVLSYVLDRRPVTDAIVRKVVDALGIHVHSILPDRSVFGFKKKDIEEWVYPSVGTWLRAFMDAKFVVTDSFHGTLFAIIFNKPFLAIGNAKRGMARFTGALGSLGLEDRLIMGPEEISDNMLRTEIEWSSIRQTIERKRERAEVFIKASLAIKKDDRCRASR